jgi:MOSC domain-containing protein YiiM
VGDIYRVGTAVVRVTTPRLPCFKLAAKFQRDDIIARFVRSGRCGFYFSVLEEGEVGAGDEFKLLGGEEPTLTIAEVNRLYTAKSPDRESLERAVEVTILPESWRERFRERLADARHR